MDPVWVAGANLLTAEAVVIAIDTSGSIRDAGRLPVEKRFAKRLLDVLATSNPKDPVVAVYVFNDNIDYIIGPTRLSALDLQWAKRAIDGIQDTSDLTWLSDAIDEACNVTSPVSPNGTLVLLTDGLPTTPDRYGSKDIPAAMQATLAAARNFRRNCSRLAVIGIGLEEDSVRFLRQVASSGAFIYSDPTLTGFRVGFRIAVP